MGGLEKVLGRGIVDFDVDDCVIFGCVESVKDVVGKNFKIRICLDMFWGDLFVCEGKER